MIVITNQRNGRKDKFKNYQKLLSHIDSMQRSKRYSHPYQSQRIDSWFIARHSHSRVMAFYDFICSQKKKSQKDDRKKLPKLDVLEISDDISRKPIMIPITPDIDIESLIESWCRRYFNSQGYDLIEIDNDDGILHVKRPIT